MQLRIALCLASWSLVAAGCGSTGAARTDSISAKLARVGLVLLSEEEAMVPPAERGRYVPVRVLDGNVASPLPPHPAGYLFVGLENQLAKDAQEILRALESWGPTETLKLQARRNPFLPGIPPDWWEGVVALRMNR